MPLPSTPVQVQQRLLSDERLALDQPDEGCLKNGSTMNPANLTRWTASKLLSLVLDVVTILFSCIFLVYGLSIKTYDGLPLDTSEAKLLKRASNLVRDSLLCTFYMVANTSSQRLRPSTQSCLLL